MKTVAIVGVGLIGGSLGLALKKFKVQSSKLKIKKIIGIGRNEEKLLLARQLGAVDEYTTNFGIGIKDADIVVIATPVDIIVPTVKKILPYLKPDCIISDVGSVKFPIVKEINKLASNLYFIGAHPLAGSEKSGVKFASENMFQAAPVVITPINNKSEKYQNAVETISNLWKVVGAKVIKMSAKEHDILVTFTSHLPHIISAALVELVHRRNKVDNRIAKLLAGSFKDITRITDSDPYNWSRICQLNRVELNKVISAYIEILESFKFTLNHRSIKDLYRFFLDTKNKRCQLLKSNQSQRKFISH